MRKVAVVGVEGSGKTVMLAGIGELCTNPNENGYFLTPKNFSTVEYVNRQLSRLRKGEWPSATTTDAMENLGWVLKRKTEKGRPVDVCELSFLDFAGEVYRAAFIPERANGALEDEVGALRRYVAEAEGLVVLINLRDVIVHGQDMPETQEAIWITNAILDFALSRNDGKKPPRTTLVLSQADGYAETINGCGGAREVLKKYLPYVAGNYGWIDVVTASSVDKTRIDRDGNVVPASDFTFNGLKELIHWMFPEMASTRGNEDMGCAEILLGDAYLSGSIAKDPEKAIKWYRRVADGGNAEALYKLALCHEKGEGVVHSPKTAAQLFEKSARLGNADAQYEYAQYCHEGVGLARNAGASAMWCLRAAEQGHVKAMRSLAEKLLKGDGVPCNSQESFSWNLRAAEAGDMEAAIEVWEKYRKTPDQSKAAFWCRRVAEHGISPDDGKARKKSSLWDSLGFFLFGGCRVEEQQTWDATPFDKARLELAVRYEKGLGIPKDLAKAFYWCRVVAQSGNTEGCCRLGRCFEEGIGMEEADAAAAVYWYKKAANLSNAEAMYYLGRCYERGTGVWFRSLEKARYWYERSFQGGYSEAEQPLLKVKETLMIRKVVG